MPRVTVNDIAEMKVRREKIPMVTAYDYTTARSVDEAGIPLVLVGDSLGMVVLGYDSTVPVTMDDMLHHCKAVARGAKRPHIVCDMPFMTYQVEASQALSNAGRLIQDGGAQSVKLEGGQAVADTVRRIVQSGIPVMGHLGLTPQSVNALGGYKVQGRSRQQALQVLQDANALQDAGAYAIVLECVPTQLACLISGRLSIPTIGIGAGPGCDGQVQVVHDTLGLFTDFVPKHAKQYAHLAGEIKESLERYAEEVRSGTFPLAQHSYAMDESIIESITVAG